MPPITRVWQNLDQELPLREVSMLTQAVEQREWFLQVITKVFLGFALIALLMASVGLYAVIAQAAASRTQEVGVRMALGASTQSIMLLVMKRGLWQIAAGLTLGVCAAFPVTHLMASLPIGVSTTARRCSLWLPSAWPPAGCRLAKLRLSNRSRPFATNSLNASLQLSGLNA